MSGSTLSSLNIDEESLLRILLESSNFVTLLSYVGGVTLLIITGLKLKELGDQQTTTRLSHVFATLFSGTFLVYFGLTHSYVATTLFGSATGVFDFNDVKPNTANFAVQYVFGFFALVGIFAMIRGLYLIRWLGHPQFEAKGLPAKIILHILFGAALYYIPSFSAALSGNIGVNVYDIYF